MTDEEKLAHANAAEKALDSLLVEEVLDEYIGNMRRNHGVHLDEGLARYGLAKVCSYVAQVARAEALGMDPEDLRI